MSDKETATDIFMAALNDDFMDIVAQKTITFFVEGVPARWQTRMDFVVQKTGKRHSVAGHDLSGKGRSWQSEVLSMALKHQPEKPLKGPIVLDFMALVPRPKRLMRKKDPGGVIPCLSKPDRTNYVKLFEDLLGKPRPSIGFRGFYQDDSQIYDGRVSKWYHAKDGKPGAWVRITYDERLQ